MTVAILNALTTATKPMGRIHSLSGHSDTENSVNKINGRTNHENVGMDLATANTYGDS